MPSSTYIHTAFFMSSLSSTSSRAHANSLSVLPNQQQEIAADTLKENDLDPEKDEKQLQELIKVIKDTVNAEKKRIREEKAAWKARIDGIGAEKKKALDELKIWKYYPQNEYPDVSGNKVRTSIPSFVPLRLVHANANLNFIQLFLCWLSP